MVIRAPVACVLVLNRVMVSAAATAAPQGQRLSSGDRRLVPHETLRRAQRGPRRPPAENDEFATIAAVAAAADSYDVARSFLGRKGVGGAGRLWFRGVQRRGDGWCVAVCLRSHSMVVR